MNVEAAIKSSEEAVAPTIQFPKALLAISVTCHNHGSIFPLNLITTNKKKLKLKPK